MIPPSAIEHHHDTLESRAEVFETDMRLKLHLSSRQMDRAFMLKVERSGSDARSTQPRHSRRHA